MENLEKDFHDGSYLDGCEKMLRASYCGGAAFTIAPVAHNLGGLYGVPHGLANAVVLPVVLDFSRETCEARLAALARIGGIGKPGDSDALLSARFIDKVREMNNRMGIPDTIIELKIDDILLIAERAVAEANPSYPVPKILNKAQCENLLCKLRP